MEDGFEPLTEGAGTQEIDSKRSILLVGDREDGLFALESALKDMGHELVRAHSGQEALRLTLGKDFAVILLDVHIPGMDGFEVAVRIRQQQKSRQTPILFITASQASPEQITRGYSLGAVDFIFKPFVPEVLKAKVRLFIELSETSEELLERETLFEGLFEFSPDAILVTNREGCVVLANARVEEVFGYARDEVVGQPIEMLVPDRLRSLHSNRRADYFTQPRTRPMGEGLELFAKRKDGSEIPVDIMLSPIRTAQGVLVLAQIRDITKRKRAEDSLRQLSGRLLQLQEEERRRLARELHDSTAQIISALTVNLELLKERTDSSVDPKAWKALSESIHFADQASREIRNLSYLLYPPLLDEAGLVPALRTYIDGFARRTNLSIKLHVSPEFGRLSHEREAALFRIVQESLGNIYRHSESPTAEIRLLQDPARVVLEVIDHGKGLPPELREELNGAPGKLGVGIRGMRERLRQLGGVLELKPANPGTIVRADLPLSGPATTQSSPDRSQDIPA